MVQNRVLPGLLVLEGKLVKTEKYRKPQYIGDPVNAVKIFNEKEVDELVVCDISTDRAQRGPNSQLIRRIADECFMPLTYGGGITNLDQIRTILKLGVEKVIINSALEHGTRLLSEAASVFGSQCVVASVDVGRDWLGRNKVCFQSGRKVSSENPESFVTKVISAGAGELIINSIDREASWKGMDIALLSQITRIAGVPVIASCGAGSIAHIKEAIQEGGASAVVLGSMSVYQQKGMGVLINFPTNAQLKEINYLKK